ncbi:MAG: transcriptional regulator, partial [Betaproteobacteria bacterium HGW-Betaproteobacteria-19]
MSIRTDIANNDATELEARHTDERGDSEFLMSLGKRVREIRDRRGMTRKLVAREAAVSERHLAHLEAGEGNVS